MGGGRNARLLTSHIQTPPKRTNQNENILFPQNLYIGTYFEFDWPIRLRKIVFDWPLRFVIFDCVLTMQARKTRNFEGSGAGNFSAHGECAALCI